MKKNEKKFKADESRDITYVLIADKASEQDEAEVKNKTGIQLEEEIIIVRN